MWVESVGLFINLGWFWFFPQTSFDEESPGTASKCPSFHWHPRRPRESRLGEQASPVDTCCDTTRGVAPSVRSPLARGRVHVGTTIVPETARRRRNKRQEHPGGARTGEQELVGACPHPQLEEAAAEAVFSLPWAVDGFRQLFRTTCDCFQASGRRREYDHAEQQSFRRVPDCGRGFSSSWGEISPSPFEKA